MIRGILILALWGVAPANNQLPPEIQADSYLLRMEHAPDRILNESQPGAMVYSGLSEACFLCESDSECVSEMRGVIAAWANDGDGLE